MVSVTMAYYNRLNLLRNTLWAYYHLHSGSSTVFEFIIVDDGSDAEQAARLIIPEFAGLIDIEVITLNREKKSSNPAIPINISVKEANGDVIVITNPEALPITPNILGLIEEKVFYKSYQVVPCYSVSDSKQCWINAEDPVNEDFVNRVCHEMYPWNNLPMRFEGDDAWYEHPLYIPRMYYFMAALLKKDFIAIGGIDEDFADSIAYEDDDFIRRLRTNHFDLSYASGTCLHQNHYTKPWSPSVWEERRINRELFELKTQMRYAIANVDKSWGIIPV